MMQPKIHCSCRTIHLVVTAFLAIALDQFSKWWILNVLDIAHRPPLVVNDYFSLVMVWNHGVSFGMLQNRESEIMPYLLIALALVIIAVLIRMARKSQQRFEQIGYALIIGGALSNVIDRLRFGAVADFFYFHVGNLGWPAFNVADSCVCIGVGVLLLHLMKSPASA